MNIEGCALERQSSDLTFELSHASCGAFNIPLKVNETAQEIQKLSQGSDSRMDVIRWSHLVPGENFEQQKNVALLCFSAASYPKTVKQCHWYDGSEYGSLEETTYGEYVFTSPTLPSYNGLPFIVGGIIGQYAGMD